MEGELKNVHLGSTLILHTFHRKIELLMVGGRSVMPHLAHQTMYTQGPHQVRLLELSHIVKQHM